ncbi:hypothetical protein MY1884_005960 [Beauveria asiatica]
MERRPESINTDLEDHSVSTLPLSQRAEMWDIAKDDFWRKNSVKLQEEFAQHSQRWSHDRSSIITHMRGTEAEIRGKKEEKLSRELAAVRSQAVLVNGTYNQEAQRLNSIDAQHNDLMLRRCRNQDGVHERQLALSEFIDKRPAESQLKLPSLTNILRLDPSPSSTAAELKALPTAAQEASVKAYSSPYRPLQAHMSSDSSPITKDTLILRHDGSVYTYPKCIEGVPVEKITPSHPYWEPSWPDLRTAVEPMLRLYEKKWSEKEDRRRRGVTLKTLADYKTDVKPVDWLRQRLYELVETQGTSFNLPKTIRDFYDDPKLAAQRQKAGFSSFGRRARAAKPIGVEPSTAESAAAAADEDPVRKKQKAAAKVPDSLETGEVSDTDSCSGAPIDEYDFRICLI